MYNQPFTFIVEGHYSSDVLWDGYIVAMMTGGVRGSPGYYFQLLNHGHANLCFLPKRDDHFSFISTSNKPLELEKDFSLVFVQKVKGDKETWSFYVNGVQEGRDMAGVPFKCDMVRRFHHLHDVTVIFIISFLLLRIVQNVQR